MHSVQGSCRCAAVPPEQDAHCNSRGAQRHGKRSAPLLLPQARQPPAAGADFCSLRQLLCIPPQRPRDELAAVANGRYMCGTT